MTRVLLDQGLPRSVALRLREIGWDAVHVFDLGMSRSADRLILDHARMHARTVITLDADFHALLAVGNEASPSVIRIRREGLRAPDLVSLLLEIWPRIQRQVENGAMVTITAQSIRLRRLPLVCDTDESESDNKGCKSKRSRGSAGGGGEPVVD